MKFYLMFSSPSPRLFSKTYTLGLGEDRNDDCASSARCDPYGRPEFEAGWSPPALLRTCHRLRQESAEIYYAKNTFTYRSGLSAVEDFFRKLEAEHRGLIRTVLHEDELLWAGKRVSDVADELTEMETSHHDLP